MLFDGILLQLSLLLSDGYCTRVSSSTAALMCLGSSIYTSEQPINQDTILLILRALEWEMLSSFVLSPSGTSAQGENQLKEALVQIKQGLDTLPGSCSGMSDVDTEDQIPVALPYSGKAMNSLFSYSKEYLSQKHELGRPEIRSLIIRYIKLLSLHRQAFDVVLCALQRYKDAVGDICQIHDRFFELEDEYVFAKSEVYKSTTVPSKRLFREANLKKLRLAEEALVTYEPRSVNPKAVHHMLIAHAKLTTFKAILMPLLQNQRIVEDQEGLLHERGLLDSGYVNTCRAIRNACRDVLLCEIHRQLLEKKGFARLIQENNRPEVVSGTSFFTEISNLLIEAKCTGWDLIANKMLKPEAPTCDVTESPSTSPMTNLLEDNPNDEVESLTNALNFRIKIAVYYILLAYGALSDRDKNWMDGHSARIANFVSQEMSELAKIRLRLKALKQSIPREGD